MADDFVNEFYENLHQETIRITQERFEQLQILETRNRILEEKVKELLIEISELQELLIQKIVVPTKKNKSIIKDVHFK
jgi:hypothetical protein